MSCMKNGVQLVEDGFDFINDPKTKEHHTVRSFTWTNTNQISVQVINYGAIITSVKLPDRNGVLEDVALGCDNIDGYLQTSNPYLGATIGRVCNRVNNATFVMNGKIYTLTKNFGNHQLHGGLRGFDKVMWDYRVEETKVVMSYLSPDGEEGYPGDVIVTVSFELSADNEFVIEMKAMCTKPTPINLTNHSYFNLAGHAAGKKELLKHVVMINANSYTPTNNEGIPTGQIKSVANSYYDLQVPRKLSDTIDKMLEGGYDVNYCLNRGTDQDISFVARVVHPPSGRVLEVYSNQPGVVFYTSNNMPKLISSFDPDDVEKSPHWPESCGCDVPDNTENPCYEFLHEKEELMGKNNCMYTQHAGFCLETQNYPDAVNHKQFPNSILNPGQTYYHKCVYKFWLTRAQ